MNTSEPNTRPINEHCKRAIEAERQRRLARINNNNTGHDAGDEDPQAWATQENTQ